MEGDTPPELEPSQARSIHEILFGENLTDERMDAVNYSFLVEKLADKLKLIDDNYPGAVRIVGDELFVGFELAVVIDEKGNFIFLREDHKTNLDDSGTENT